MVSEISTFLSFVNSLTSQSDKDTVRDAAVDARYTRVLALLLHRNTATAAGNRSRNPQTQQQNDKAIKLAAGQHLLNANGGRLMGKPSDAPKGPTGLTATSLHAYYMTSNRS